MNALFALLILIAYVLIHAKKAKLSPLEWLKANVLTTVCAAAILLGSLLVPKSVLMAVASWVGTPMLLALALKWGVVSVVSNLFTMVSAFVKKGLNL